MMSSTPRGALRFGFSFLLYELVKSFEFDRSRETLLSLPRRYRSIQTSSIFSRNESLTTSPSRSPLSPSLSSRRKPLEKLLLPKVLEMGLLVLCLSGETSTLVSELSTSRLVSLLSSFSVDLNCLVRSRVLTLVSPRASFFQTVSDTSLELPRG